MAEKTFHGRPISELKKEQRKSDVAMEKKEKMAGKMKGKGMKEGHNIITKDKIYNRLYPGGFKTK